MKITAIQMDLTWEDREPNYKRARKLAKQAKKEGADMVVLPEMFAVSTYLPGH